MFPDSSVVNRTIAACLHEHYVGFVERRLRNEIKKLEGHPKEQGELLFDCVKMIDEKYGSEHEAIYNSLSKKEQEEYMKNLISNFGVLHLQMQRMIWKRLCSFPSIGFIKNMNGQDEKISFM